MGFMHMFATSLCFLSQLPAVRLKLMYKQFEISENDWMDEK